MRGDPQKVIHNYPTMGTWRGRKSGLEREKYAQRSGQLPSVA
jgi:hypothetical protein